MHGAIGLWSQQVAAAQLGSCSPQGPCVLLPIITPYRSGSSALLGILALITRSTASGVCSWSSSAIQNSECTCGNSKAKQESSKVYEWLCKLQTILSCKLPLF